MACTQSMRRCYKAANDVLTVTAFIDLQILVQMKFDTDGCVDTVVILCAYSPRHLEIINAMLTDQIAGK